VADLSGDSFICRIPVHRSSVTGSDLVAQSVEVVAAARFTNDAIGLGVSHARTAMAATHASMRRQQERLEVMMRQHSQMCERMDAPMT
jgi:hypothetical protein